MLRAERPGSRSGPRLPGKWLTIGLFLLPALALYLVFVIVPIIQAAHFSLFKWNGLGPLEDFIGLKNYQVALASDVFWQAVGNNVLVIVLSLLIQIPFSLALAVLLNRRFPGRAIFRLLFFLPYVLSEAITGIVFSLLLQPDALVDSRPEDRRSRRTHPGLARQHRHRDAHAVRDHLVEILRVPHDPAAGRAPGHPAGRSRRPR